MQDELSDDESGLSIEHLDDVLQDDASDSEDERLYIERQRQLKARQSQAVPMECDSDEDAEAGNSEDGDAADSSPEKAGPGPSLMELLGLPKPPPPKDDDDPDLVVLEPPPPASSASRGKGGEAEEEEDGDGDTEKNAVDYSALFDEDGDTLSPEAEFATEDATAPRRPRDPRSERKVFNLKKPRRKKRKTTATSPPPSKTKTRTVEYTEVSPETDGSGKPVGHNGSAGIAALMADEERDAQLSKAVAQGQKHDRDADDRDRDKVDKINKKRHGIDEFTADLLSAMSSRRAAVDQRTSGKLKQTKKKDKAKPKPTGKRRKEQLPAPRAKKKASGEPKKKKSKREPKKPVFSIATTAKSALDAADALEQAANARAGLWVKERTIFNRRRNKITNAPDLVKTLEYITKTIVINKIYPNGQASAQSDEEKAEYLEIIKQSQRFVKLAKQFGDALTKRAREFFALHDNKGMLMALDALADTGYATLRPTVKRVPSQRAIDIWSADEIDAESIKEKASIILQPNEDVNGDPSMSIMPKHSQLLPMVVHVAMHLPAYTQDYINEALKTVEGISADLPWRENWKKCAGEVLFDQPAFSWPVGDKSKGSNPFVSVYVSVRHVLEAALHIHDDLGKIIKNRREIFGTTSSRTQPRDPEEAKEKEEGQE